MNFTIAAMAMTIVHLILLSASFQEGFYFACFLAGLLLSVISLIGGLGHISWHFHPPHVPHASHVPVGHGQIAAQARGTATIPWWNAFSIMAFLCWFGAAGYLMTRYGSLIAGTVFVLSVLCGLVGGGLVFWFVARVLLPHERELTPDETSVCGAVGHVSAMIRAGGTGEILYVQMGARRSVPARSDKGEVIAHGEEVFVVRYEKGIAYVRRWEDLQEMLK